MTRGVRPTSTPWRTWRARRSRCTRATTPSPQRVRLSILAGVDAEWFARQTQAGSMETAPQEPGSVDVCALGRCGQLRTEFKKMRTGLSLDASLEEMQNCFLSMRVSYQTPFPESIAVSHPNVPNDAWPLDAQLQHPSV